MENTTLTYDNLRRVLDEWADRLKEQYIQNIIDHKRPTTRNTLVDTIEVDVTQDGEVFHIVLTLQDYWKYIEKGTRPHFPPLDAIREWVTIKPVLPRPNKNGKLPSERDLAFMIAKKISKVGTKGKPSLKSAIKSTGEQFKDEVQRAIAQDVGRWATASILLAL